MRPEIKVSISAKLEHAKKLMQLKPDGFHINSRWIPLEAAGATNRMRPVTHWQQENFDDIAMAHFHILYVEPGDSLKGAVWETGWACGRGKRIWIAGDGHGVDVPAELLTNIPPPAKRRNDDGPDHTIRLPHRALVPWAQYRQQVRIVMSLEQAFKEIDSIVNQFYNVNNDGGVKPEANFFEL